LNIADPVSCGSLFVESFQILLLRTSHFENTFQSWFLDFFRKRRRVEDKTFQSQMSRAFLGWGGSREFSILAVQRRGACPLATARQHFGGSIPIGF